MVRKRVKSVTKKRICILLEDKDTIDDAMSMLEEYYPNIAKQIRPGTAKHAAKQIYKKIECNKMSKSP